MLLLASRESPNDIHFALTLKVHVYRAAGWIVLTFCAIAACGGAGGSDRNSGGNNNGGSISGPGTPPVLPSSIKSCGTAKAVFTTPPIALAELSGWVPLGSMNPTGHLFPVDHQYLYHTNPDRPGGPIYRAVNVVSPGDIVITNARRSVYSTGNVDYSINFYPCADLFAVFGHVQTLTQSLVDQFGPFDQFCESATAGTASIGSCSTKQLNISITAGTQLGTAGGIPNTSFGLDFLLEDKRIKPLVFANPTRWLANASGFDSYHIVASSDYYAEPALSQIALRLGQFDGSMQRTIAPIGGTIEVDVPGTAQGYWFHPTKGHYPEEPHLTIAPDNVNPTVFAFSMGISQPGFQPGLYRFTPATSGKVNRHPAQVTVDGQIYCYEIGFQAVLLVRLMDPTTLRVEGRQTGISCESQLPYNFTSASFDYLR